MGHTEDALSETVNNYYIVAAHVVPGEAETGGLFDAREEKFEALAYAGHLPGYASGHNHHGLVFSINTIFVSEPLRGKIREFDQYYIPRLGLGKVFFIMSVSAREFITRALLSSNADLDEILSILTNEGVGTADGFNVNLAFMNVARKSRVFHTIEVSPKVDEDKSEVYLNDFQIGSNSLHTNRSVFYAYNVTPITRIKNTIEDLKINISISKYE